MQLLLMKGIPCDEHSMAVVFFEVARRFFLCLYQRCVNSNLCLFMLELTLVLIQSVVPLRALIASILLQMFVQLPQEGAVMV